MISLKTKTKRDAQTKANRFLTILEESKSWDAAVTDLRGKKVVRKGEDPDHATMELLYRAYMAQAANPVKSATLKNNLQALDRLMRKCGAATVSGIRQEKIKFTDENRSSLFSEIAGASSVFKPAALTFYERRGIRLENPFKGMEKPKKTPDPYVPMSDKGRQKVWKECGKQDGTIEMITLLALGCGLRRSEIDKARVSWISKQRGKAVFSVQQEEDFIPKSRVSRSFPVSDAIVKRIMSVRRELNPEKDDPYLIPDSASKSKGLRLMRHYKKISAWLLKMNVPGNNRLHTLRKEFGSLVATKHGIFVASKYLGHSSVVVTEEHYASLVKQPDIDIGSLIDGDDSEKRDSADSLAKRLGVKPSIITRALMNLNLKLVKV